MGCLPLGLERGEVAGDLRATLRHHGVPRLQLCCLARYWIKGEAVRVEDGGELGVRGENGGAQCPDRALLPG